MWPVCSVSGSALTLSQVQYSTGTVITHWHRCGTRTVAQVWRLRSVTHTLAQVLLDAEEGVGQVAGAPAQVGLFQAATAEDSLHIQPQQHAQEAAALHRLGGTGEAGG